MLLILVIVTILALTLAGIYLTIFLTAKYLSYTNPKPKTTDHNRPLKFWE